MNTTKRPYVATIGSISEGSLRPEDLIPTFADELRALSRDNPEPYAALIAKADAWRDGDATQADDDAAPDIIYSLKDALSEFSPPYCYFGSHPGGGADFGFWPDMESVDELPRVNDPSEIPDNGTGEDCVYVNDHGNVTVYGGDGKIIWDCV